MTSFDFDELWNQKIAVVLIVINETNLDL